MVVANAPTARPATLADARAWLAAHTARLPAERLPLAEAQGRVLAASIRATPLPAYPHAAIAGLAVRAADTEGAADYAPLTVQGTELQAGDPMPSGTDAVLPPPAYDGATALAPVAPGANVVPAGYDAPDGWTLPAGSRLTFLHLTLLARLGHSTIAVTRHPRVLATDDLLLDALLAAAHATRSGSPDLVLHTAPPGAPASLALCPGETTSLRLRATTPTIHLPRDPVAAATVFTLLVAPALRAMEGRPEPHPFRATLARKVVSPLGQLDAIRVRLDGGVATPLGPAEGCSLVRALEADGLLLVPEGSEGHVQGATVEIWPL